ncbi:hypothetical protein [Agaribacterium sp. ZY112]|uniref:hypothetical protein n=1 Tax=Agaribacterium sp. ZY112 TaxID=3233574 RepID=UPI0035256362
MSAVFTCVCKLDKKLRASISLHPVGQNQDCWQMRLKLFYEKAALGKLSFDLKYYSFKEAQELALNFHKYGDLMSEVDMYLSSGSD